MSRRRFVAQNACIFEHDIIAERVKLLISIAYPYFSTMLTLDAKRIG